MSVNIRTHVKTKTYDEPDVFSIGKDLGKNNTVYLSPHVSTLVILDDRSMARECLAQSIVSRGCEMEVAHFGSVEDWKNEEPSYPPLAAILLNIGGRSVSEPKVHDSIRRLCTQVDKVPVVLLADTDEIQQVLKALEAGVRGYIPSTVGVGVCIEVISVAVAGGIFVPASSIRAISKFIENGSEVSPLAKIFTTRQAEVIEALRRGKANKIIAHELKLRESTVKVHVRNIMRKLKANNRTEVAFKINDMFPHSLTAD